MGYGFEDERRRLIDEVIMNKHHGLSKDISAGRSDAFKQIQRAVSWVPPHRRGIEARKREQTVPISWVREKC